MKSLFRLCWSLTDSDPRIRHRARVALFWIVFATTIIGLSAKVVLGGVYTTFLS